MADDWYTSAGQYAGDILGLGPNSYNKGLSAAATKLAKTLDSTIQNTYVGSGWANAEKTKPNIRNIITQSPELIVLVKKRMFSSLKDNYLSEHMDATEKAFIKASKKLFENKCKIISAYEQLTKLQRLVEHQGTLTNGIVSSILDGLDHTNSLLNITGITSPSPEAKSFQRVASKIRDLLTLNGYNTTTTWVNNTRNPSIYANGAGTGVIELTLVTQFNCTTSIRFGGGSANFTILDPMRLFTITEQDIERAIYETSDDSFSVVNQLADDLQTQYDADLQELNNKREKRNASTITVNVDHNSRVYNRIVITLDRYGIELTSSSGDGLRTDLFNTSGDQGFVLSNEQIEENFNALINTVKVDVALTPGRATQSLASLELFADDEKDLLTSILDKMIMISTLRQKDYADFRNYSKKSNYIRKMLRLNFLGKLMIQSMDIVTAFINSNAIDDNAALAGLKSMFSVNDAALNGIKNITYGTGSAMSWIGSKTNSDWLKENGDKLEEYANSNDQWLREQAKSAKQYLDLQSLDMSNISRANPNVAGSLNKNIGDLKELWGGITGTNKHNYALEAEKNALAGPDFPMYLYLSLRSYFGASDFGPCVFNGVVLDAGESGQPGSCSIAVNCKDNTHYFTQVLYQEKPAINQFNGHLYDPLTPFDIEFDEATGKTNVNSSLKLSDENLALINSGVLKYHFGRFVNQQVTSKNIYQTALEPIDTSSDNANFAKYNVLTNGSVTQEIARKVFYNPDGFVYKWKKGIGTAWINSSDRNAAGTVLSEDRIDNQVANIVRADPFSNQDVVNVMSLLITGEPYNINTFLNASITSGILRVIPGQTINDYLSNLTRQVRKQNQIWGDFVPFKRFSINPTYFNQLYTSKLNLQSHSSKISQLEDKKAKLMDKLMNLDSSYTQTSNLNDLQGYNYDSKNTNKYIIVHSAASMALVNQIITLDNEIKACQAKIQESISSLTSIDGKSSQGPITIVGNEVYSSYDGDLDTMKNESRAAYKSAYNRLRMKQNFLTQRKLWQVKSNTDTNLFIVCDEYDQDTDIQALMQNLGSLDFINSKGFSNVGSKIDALAKTVGLEVFANSQGHIEVRIPQYNKVPSSIFYKMFERKRKFGIQYYPSFLEKTFSNRLDNVYNELETLEDWIRIYTTLLGYKSDDERAIFLTGTNNPTPNNYFVFLTDPNNGTLASIRAASSQIAQDFTDEYETVKFISMPTTSSTKDFFERNTDDSFASTRYEYFQQNFEGNNSNAKSMLDALQTDKLTAQVKNWKSALAVKNTFNPIQQMENINVIFQKNLTLPQIQEDNTDFNADFIRILQRQNRRTGSKITADSLIKTTFSNSKKYVSPIDLVAIEKKLSTLISQRYKALLSATSLIKNLDQTARANNDDNVLAGIMLPNLMKDGDVPDFMAHMIEDETEDDYGLGAGKRFIIRKQDILASSYKEQAPEFTAIKVQGAQAGGLLPSRGFDVGGGMETLSVWAVDYDLWRMYGFKDGAERFVPFMNNVETQIAPYAVSLLNQQRSSIFHGSITRVGNEFVQPGEVYYSEEKDTLFYCEQVSHSFSYGSPGSFTTTMALTYGHPIGEYIATPLDTFGKAIYKGSYTNIGNYRMSNPVGGTTNSNIEIHLGTIAAVPPNNMNISTPEEGGELICNTSSYAEHNTKTLTDIQYKIKNIMTSSGANVSSSKCAVVALRIYCEGTKYNLGLKQVAYYIAKFLQNPNISKNNNNDELPVLQLNKYRIVGGKTDDENIVEYPRYVNINVDPNQISVGAFPGIRNPSGKAIELAKEIAEDDEFIKKALCNNIVDIWVEYINPDESYIKKSSPFTSANSNQAQTKNSSTDPSAIDNFYSNIKRTEDGFSDGKSSITIKFRPGGTDNADTV